MPTTPPLRPEEAARLAATLRTLRTERGLSQEELAHRAGMSRNQYQLLEKGLSNRTSAAPSNPHLSTVVAIAAALDTSVARVITDVFQPPEGVHVEIDGPLH